MLIPDLRKGVHYDFDDTQLASFDAQGGVQRFLFKGKRKVSGNLTNMKRKEGIHNNLSIALLKLQF